jgi:predicted MFS family arabinose efflux permease
MTSRPGTPETVAPGADPRYGWVLVLVGALSMAYQAGLVGGRAVFVAAIPEESGWSRAATAAAISSLALGSGLWAPVVGHAVQRWGARRTMPISALVMGAGVVASSLASSPLEFGLISLLLVAPGSMGVGSLANFAAIQAWFVARRGTALALADSGSSLGLMLFVPLTQLLVELLGWRTATLAIGLAGLLLAPLHGLLQRTPPTDLPGSSPRPRAARDTPSSGHHETAHRETSSAAHGSAHTPAHTASIWSLIRTSRFVILVSGMSGIWLAQQIVITHHAAYLSDHGYDAVSIATTFALIGLTGLAGRPTFGWLSDRLGTTRTFGLLTIGLVGGIGALVLAGDGQVPRALWLYGVTLGASLGVGTLLFARQVSSLFGQQRFGTIMGLGYCIGIAIGAAGATLAGFARDVTGTYVPSFGVAALAAVLAFVCVWLLGRAHRP